MNPNAKSQPDPSDRIRVGKVILAGMSKAKYQKTLLKNSRLLIGGFYTFVVQGNDLHCYIDFYWKMCFSIYL
jgi:hypothetical protein